MVETPIPTIEETSKDTETWSKDLKRIARRHQIRETMELGKTSLATIKETVRAFEDANRTDLLIEELTAEEFVIPPEVSRIMTEVSSAVIKRYPKVKALVLLGSGSHGGAVIRTITNHFKDMGIDWGIITQGELSESMRKEINSAFSEELANVTKDTESFANLKGCCGINPATCAQLSQPMLENAQDFLEKFKAVLSTPFVDKEIEGYSIYPEYFTPTSSVFLYLNPSYPPESNQHNREIIKEGLELLQAKDSMAWENAMAQLIREWSMSRRFSIKNFPPITYRDRDSKDMELVNKLLDEIPARKTPNFLQSP